MKHLGIYKLEDFAKSRVGTVDIGYASKMKHQITSLIELDVTEARKMLRELKKENKGLSFNAWIIKCISKAVEENKSIHGIRKGKKKIVVFDDIDITIMIEREVDGIKVPLPYLIRKTNEKSVQDIALEITNAQNQAINNEGDYVLGEKKNARMMNLYASAPRFLRRFIWKKILHSPFLTKSNMGTVMITSVGMIGRINGWVIPKSVHPLSFAIGSIIKKPGIVKGNIEIRDYLYVTVLVDHDVIDGAPAIRALSKMVELIEKGDGLK